MNKRVISVIFIISVILGVVVGYVVDEYNERKKQALASEDEKDEINLKGIEITSYDYIGDYYVVNVNDYIEDINKYLEDDMVKYLIVIEKAMKKDGRRERKGKVKVVIGKGNKDLEIIYSKNRLDSVERTLGRTFFIKQVESKGWDLLNNSDSFWIAEYLQNEIKDDIKERISWDKMNKK